MIAMAGCEQWAKDLLALADGELGGTPDVIHGGVLAHVGNCKRCAADVNALAEVARMYGEDDPPRANAATWEHVWRLVDLGMSEQKADRNG